MNDEQKRVILNGIVLGFVVLLMVAIGAYYILPAQQAAIEECEAEYGSGNCTSLLANALPKPGIGPCCENCICG